MGESVFRFRQFSVRQGQSAMKIGTDAMLLGSLIPLEEANNVLDIGSGTGVLALMMAQRLPKAKITAIDIEETAATEAGVNFMNSPWPERLSVQHISLQDFKRKNIQNFELIISNPPFHEPINKDKGGNTQKPDENRAIARLRDSLPFNELAKYSAGLLAPAGTLWVIIPYWEREHFSGQAVEWGLQLTNEVDIRSKPGGEYIRCILGFRRAGYEIILRKEFVIYGPDSGYSVEYIKITKEFHDRDL